MQAFNRVLDRFLVFWDGRADPNKAYHYSDGKKPESAYGRFLAIISTVLAIFFSGIQVLGSISVGQAAQQSEVRQA